jgi:hypothetical protein
MPKRYLDGDVKIEKNIFHEYHKVIDPQTGQIDQTDFRVCKCRHCSIWTPEILKAHDDFLIEQEKREKREKREKLNAMFRLPAFYGGSKN